MKKNILLGSLCSLIISGTLIPLYGSNSKYGIYIGCLIGVISGVLVFIYSYHVEEGNKNKKEEFNQFQNNIINCIKDINNKMIINISNENQKIIEQIDNLSSKTEEVLNEFNKKHEDNIKTQHELNDIFHEKIDKIVNDLSKHTAVVEKGQYNLVHNQEKISNKLFMICNNSEKQIEEVSTELGKFTNEIKKLFVERIEEDFKELKEIKESSLKNLSKITEIIEDSLNYNKEYLQNLSDKFTPYFELYNSGQNKFYENVKNSMNSLQDLLEETLEDLSDQQEGLIKKQSKTINDVLDEIRISSENINNNVKLQSEHHKEEVQVLNKMQNEILSLNQKDLELIRMMMDAS
ncbi:hypothetical protein SH2C18_45320 [Clostridium sediminicola]|uniref:hypothetical protein n=1 Tax=Clostridium sediminicola TaxID=3114879 RepID=UPI0031F1EB8F